MHLNTGCALLVSAVMRHELMLDAFRGDYNLLLGKLELTTAIPTTAERDCPRRPLLLADSVAFSEKGFIQNPRIQTRDLGEPRLWPPNKLQTPPSRICHFVPSTLALGCCV